MNGSDRGGGVDPAAVRERVERHIRAHELIPPGGDVVALVSGGPDSTCLWHVLRALGYRVSALHVDHGLRGRDSAADARFCREVLGAEVVQVPPARTEANLLRLADERPRLPRGLEATLAALLASSDGTKRADLGRGITAVREYD